MGFAALNPSGRNSFINGRLGENSIGTLRRVSGRAVKDFILNETAPFVVSQPARSSITKGTMNGVFTQARGLGGSYLSTEVPRLRLGMTQ